MNDELNDIRDSILDKAEDSERIFNGCLIAAALIELVCLVAFLLLMDFGETLHWLILVSAVMIYWTLFCGLGAVVADMRRQCVGLLRAIELLDRDTANDEHTPSD